MLRKVTIQNYKSILDDTFELGRINVFIGENGCGKSNILEALALAAASTTEHLGSEELFLRGIRVARPELMRSSFAARERGQVITVRYELDGPATSTSRTHELTPRLNAHGLIAWACQLTPPPVPSGDLDSGAGVANFHDFLIYNANILALRGLEVISRREPLGIHGEGLDVLLGTLPEEEFSAVNEAMQCIRWIRQVELDRAGERRFQGLRLGRSRSNLYFIDRFMADDNNVFSAENANEGALHVLFYLALFSAKRTPAIFGIDNIETALNPQLCRDLIKQLAILAARNDKQALITTHNPAILDGLNLHDDEQRLFVVYRTDEGHTRTRRIKVKPDAKEPLKLSELWMRGYLGGLPQGF